MFSTFVMKVANSRKSRSGQSFHGFPGDMFGSVALPRLQAWWRGRMTRQRYRAVQESLVSDDDVKPT
jgi:hypothetical protein